MSCLIVRNGNNVAAEQRHVTGREQMWMSSETVCPLTCFIFHLQEKEKICETLMTLRGILCSENVMER